MVLSESPTPFLPYGDGIESELKESRGLHNPSKLSIASYNIRYGVGQFLISTGLLRKAGLNLPFRRREVVGQHIASAAAALNAQPFDLIGIQEADKFTQRAGQHHIAKELAEALEMSWVHAAAGIPRGIPPQQRQWWLDFEEQIGLYDEGDTGVAILSHVLLSGIKRLDLPWHECPWRPRLSLAVSVDLNGTSVRILNSHIDPHSSIGGQIEQLEIVLAEADRAPGPVLLLGDFNTLSKKKCHDTRRLLESRGFTTPFKTGTSTWRGAGIRLHADWIFVRQLKVEQFGVIRPLKSSDHWPIWAEVSLLDTEK